MADEELVPKKNSTSVIWGWFGFAVSDVSQTRIICKVCRATVGSSGGNTTNLFNHLRRKHPKDYAESASLRAAQLPARSLDTKIKQLSFTGYKQATKREQSSKLWEKTPYEQLAVRGGPAGKAVPVSGNRNWDGAGGMDQITEVRIDDTHIAEDQSHVGGKGKDGAAGYYEMEYSVPEEEEEAEEEEDSVYVIEYSNPEEDGESYQFTMSVDRSLPTRKPIIKYPVVRNHGRAPVPVASKPAVPPRPRHKARKRLVAEQEQVVCSKRVLEYADVVPMHSDSGKQLLCSLCPPPGRLFKRGAGLAVHLKQMHGIERKKTFFCTSCQKSVRTQIQLDRHTKRHAYKRAVFTCHLCAAETENKPEVEKTGFSGSKRGLRTHLEKEHPGVIPRCNICDKHFKTLVSYLADQFKHIGVSPYYCAKCQIYEMTERGLSVHIRNHDIEKRKKQDVQPQASAGENHLQALGAAAGVDNSATDDSDTVLD